MYCPNCHGEYREGFTICSDCDVPLVESLAPEVLRQQEAAKLQPLELGVLVWLGVLLLYWLLPVIHYFPLMGTAAREGDGTFLLQAGIRLGVLFLLPLLAMVAVYRRKPWAKTACTIALVAASLHSFAQMLVLTADLFRGHSVVAGFSKNDSIWLGWFSGSLVVSIAALWLIRRRGFELAPPASPERSLDGTAAVAQ